MRGLKLRLREGISKDAFEDAVLNCQEFHKISAFARITVACGLDRTFGITGNKRIRIKKMKRFFQRAMQQTVMDMVEKCEKGDE